VDEVAATAATEAPVLADNAALDEGFCCGSTRLCLLGGILLGPLPGPPAPVPPGFAAMFLTCVGKNLM